MPVTSYQPACPTEPRPQGAISFALMTSCTDVAHALVNTTKWGRFPTCRLLPLYRTPTVREGTSLSSKVSTPVTPAHPARRRNSGQTLVEFALSWGTIILPLTFAIIFTSELLWIWHSVADFTRDGARYAATHCWQGDGSNVVNYMKANIPLMPDQAQFQNGPAQIEVTYFSRDPDSGRLVPFACAGDCSTACIPDVVTVAVTNYQFTSFVTTLGIPPIPIPDFHTSVPIESAGCDPEQGVCLP